MLKSIARILLYLLVGGVMCWLPDVAIHLKRGYGFSRLDVVMVSVLMPVSSLLAYLIVTRLLSTQLRTPSVAFFMFVGIWLFGSLAMMISATPTGGGFSTPGTGYAIVFSLLPLPPYTFMMATYDMSLAGLAFASLAMIAMHLVFERHHWILPRKLMSWLQLPAV
jgi:hypothetical protein